MKKHIGTYITFSCILMLGFSVLTGCTKSDTTSGKNTKVEENVNKGKSQGSEEEVEETQQPEVEETVSPEATTNPKDADKKKDIQELPIYSINEESLEAEAATATVPKESEISPEVVVMAVVDSLKAQSIEVGVDSVSVEGDSVVVSFLRDGSCPLEAAGSSVETAILDSISNSLLDNIDSCKQVIFRAEGKAYESGHYAFEYDEPYMQ